MTDTTPRAPATVTTPLAELIGARITLHMTGSDAWCILAALEGGGEPLGSEGIAAVLRNALVEREQS